MTPRAVIAGALGLAFGLLAGTSERGMAQTDRDAVIRWATAAKQPLRTTKPGSSTRDLDAQLRMIGPARIAALSEAVHLGAEPLEFRNRLFQALVERAGLTAIATWCSRHDSTSRPLESPTPVRPTPTPRSDWAGT